MTTGADLLAVATGFLGQPYSTEPGRDDPARGHKDCSGLIAASYLAVENTYLSSPRFHGVLVIWRRLTPGCCRVGLAG